MVQTDNCLSSNPLGHMHIIVLVQQFVSWRVSFVKNITTRRSNSNSFSIITLFYLINGGVHCMIYFVFFYLLSR